MITYPSLEQVLHLHARLVAEFGGSDLVRDRAALEAALARPQATFDGEDLYSDLAAKAAALLHSLVQGHPFADGNKRVGAMIAELFLLLNGHALEADDDTLIELVRRVARGELAAEPLTIWIRQRLVPLER